MNVNDLLVKDCMIMDLKATTKASAIDEMVQKLYDTGRISDIETFKAGILAREAQTSTGLGDGVAMPHAKNAAVKEATVLFAKSNLGLDYEALDGQPTFLFFMIAAPEGANDTHLQALAALSRQLIHPDFIAKLKNATSPDEIQKAFADAEKADAEKEAKAAAAEPVAPKADQKFVVAVTACPTGIAHTYMAADALNEKAQTLGVLIKVETNGSDGVKNRLTAEDIARADGVIIAADKNVEMARFDGKPLLNRPVSDGIRKTEELITKAMNGDAPIYHSKAADTEEKDSAAAGSVGQQLYKHLMNGVSHMLPFVIGGGIAIAIAFFIDNMLGVPSDQLGNLGSYHQVAAIFKGIGGVAFGFMLPVLAGFIGSSIADRPGLVTGFVAGALAGSGDSFKSLIGVLNTTTLAEAGKDIPAAMPSGFLGALVGGFLAGYTILFLKKIFANLPKSLEGIKTILFLPVFGVIITGALMLAVNIPMSAINTGLNNFLDNMSGTNAVLLGALLGGMMAIDMGGPINKAAYVFGTGTLAASVQSGGSVVMAAVMAGGMVPPLAIFIASLVFKNKFTKSEKESGLTNLIMGLSFITEGAIPFAAADPARTIPSFFVGSAVAGGLVAALNIKLMAPHGGIFVIGLVDQKLLYLVAILVGSVASAILLGILRKTVDESAR